MRPCPACRRHVRDERACPFCGAAVAPAAPRGLFAGPVTRAAVFSALAGCWTGSTPAEQTTTVEHKTETHEHERKPPPPPTTAGTVEGTVIDSNTGSGVTYAEVRLLDASGQVVGTASTDGAGRYRFDNIAPGPYTVHVLARGNNPRAGGASVAAKVVVGDQGAHADLQVAIPVYRYNPTNTPMPYGAPPARKRVV